MSTHVQVGDTIQSKQELDVFGKPLTYTVSGFGEDYIQVEGYKGLTRLKISFRKFNTHWEKVR